MLPFCAFCESGVGADAVASGVVMAFVCVGVDAMTLERIQEC